MTRRRAAGAVLGLVVVAATLVQVSVEHPRVHVRWRDGVGEAQRAALERQYRLEGGERVEGATWRYELRERSPENVGALVEDPNVADTAYLDRSTRQVAEPRVVVSFQRARALAGPEPLGFIQPQTGILVAAGGVMLWAAGLADGRRRQVALAVLLATGICAFVVPLRQPIRMGDSSTYVETREQFDGYTGVRQIRFEAHLAHAILAQIDRLLGRTADSPARALDTLMRAATVWFLVMAVAVGMVERWSPVAVRYLALVVIAPCTLLYFGYREIGHLSLNLLTFPLLVRGLRSGGRHLETSGALAGFGAALHGFGLLAIAGSVLAAIGRVAASPRHASAAVLRLLAWSIAAYIGWVAIYEIVLKLPILPGHADAIPLRPWFADVTTDRVNVAIFSWRGVRDVTATALLVGMPLLAVAATLRRQCPFETRAALLYAAPSTAFVVLFWPIQGLGVEMDLLFAAFPAVYALAWVCAHDRRGALIAAVVLAGAHLVFWRVALDSAFVNSRVP